MKHYRDPTCSHAPKATPPDTETTHATLALRHHHTATPTLLSTLRTSTNTPHLNGGDSFDDFQSNAWIESYSYRPTLAGLGISYTTDTASVSSGMKMDVDSQPLASEANAIPMNIDTDDHMLNLTTVLSPGALHYSPSYSSAVSFDHLSLSYTATDSISSISHRPPHCYGPGPACDHLAFGHDDIHTLPSDSIGLIPDVNMYDVSLSTHPALANVNPLDTIGGIPSASVEGSVVQRPQSRVAHTEGRRGSPVGEVFTTEECLSPVIKDIMSILTQSARQEFKSSLSPPKTLSAHKRKISTLSADELIPSSPLVSSKMEDKFLPSCQSLPLEPFTSGGDSAHAGVPVITHSSPVLNAHLGIELSELSLRADRFKAQNPGQEIDRTWLSHFAGKLSERGELLGEFRCYVIGCNQRNKRRDHILVHVGAHIGQRPFACSVCSLRFLRKNECKRHEASHTGFRPYSCDLCGQSFVRQDLVKRHIKRTHTSGDGNRTPPKRRGRKKAKVQ